MVVQNLLVTRHLITLRRYELHHNLIVRHSKEDEKESGTDQSKMNNLDLVE